MKDGDLWKMFQDFVAWRGPWSVWLSKVKGHATQEQVERGAVKAEDKEGNDLSDEAAGEGSKDDRNS